MHTKVVCPIIRSLALTTVLLSCAALPQSYADSCTQAHPSLQEAARWEQQREDTEVLLIQERLYRHAIGVSPRCAKAFNNLGHVYERRGKSREAIEAYHTAITLAPEAPYPYLGLGDVHFDNRQYADAVRWFKAGLARGPLAADTQEIYLKKRLSAEELEHGNHNLIEELRSTHF